MAKRDARHQPEKQVAFLPGRNRPKFRWCCGHSARKSAMAYCMGVLVLKLMNWCMRRNSSIRVRGAMQ